MRDKRSGFTLAEVFLCMVLLITITAMMLPVLKKIMPDSDAAKFKQAYFATLSVIDNMVSDSVFYPDARGFADTSVIRDNFGVLHGGDSKFAEAFKMNLNIIKEGITAGSGQYPYGMDDEDKVKSSTNNECVKANTGIIYCLPKKVDTLDANNPSGNGAVFVRLYINDKDGYDIKQAFFVGIKANGKIFLPLNVPNYFDCTISEDGRQRDRDYNQCKANGYLSSAVFAK